MRAPRGSFLPHPARGGPRAARLSAVLLLAALPLAAPGSASAEPVPPGGPQSLTGTGIVVAPTSPVLPEINAEAWLLADLDTGAVLAAKDPHGQFAPASTLKALTALTLIPRIDPDRQLVPTFDDVNVDGSKVGVVERVGYPARELFGAMLMVSGNDAANVLASAEGGTAATAALMNATALEIGANDTHAVNPHGLDATGQVSSPYDLAVIGRAGLANADFARYVSTLSSSISGPGGARIATSNHDKMLRSYPGSLGVKNGFTIAARASFIGAARRDGHGLVVGIMKSTPKVFDEAAKLMDWGFANPNVATVGQLPPVPATVEAEAGTTRAVLATPLSTVPRTAPGPGGTSFPVTVAGMALAAAALMVVRRRPAGAGASRARASRPPSRPRTRQQAPVRPVRRTAAPPRPSPARDRSRVGGRDRTRETVPSRRSAPRDVREYGRS